MLEDRIPVLYYKLLGIRRRLYKKKQAKLSVEQIKQLVDAQYYSHCGQHVNWENPKAYNEKIQVDKVFNLFPEKARLADKYAVREWVAEKIGEEYLIPLIGVYDSAYDIDFDKLPNAFAIKTNAGSGDVVIVRDKSKLSRKDIRRIKAKMQYWLGFGYEWAAYEMHYKDIVPKVVVEKLIEYEKEDLPDYKFLCFDGKPVYFWIDKGRFHEHQRNVYDMEWNLQPWVQKKFRNYEGDAGKPEGFDKMVELATVLSEGFQHVRVDLYNVNGKIYFGEMTFTSGGGISPIVPYEADLQLGELWHLKI